MEEVWKDIKGYNGDYQVSSIGRVKSKKIKKHKILKPGYRLSNKKKTYDFVVLCKNNNCKKHSVHRLVAQAFIPNPENKPQVNHIDFNKKNNNVSNLEWCTISENKLHDIKHNRVDDTNRWKSSVKKVMIYNQNEKLYFDSTKLASAYIGCHHKGVERVARGDRNSVYGWKAKYI